MSTITTAQRYFCLSVIAERKGMSDMAQELLNRSLSSSDMDELLSMSSAYDSDVEAVYNYDMDDLELAASSILGASLLPTTLGADNDVHLTSTSSTRLKIRQ